MVYNIYNKLKRPFFICYQGSHHEICLLGFGWELIEFWHSKGINQPKFELQLNLALNLDILPESPFYKKRWLCPLSVIWEPL